MATEFMPVSCTLLGNLENWVAWHSSLGLTFTDRVEANAWGEAELGHDDFRIATLVDGKLAAIGWGMEDFPPGDDDLPAIAEQLSLELAVSR